MNDDLKCCGNCHYYKEDSDNTYFCGMKKKTYCYYVCDDWVQDGLTYNGRKEFHQLGEKING